LAAWSNVLAYRSGIEYQKFPSLSEPVAVFGKVDTLNEVPRTFTPLWPVPQAYSKRLSAELTDYADRLFFS